MKKMLLILSLALSYSAFSVELSSNHCQVTVDNNGVAEFTNVISSAIKLEDGSDYLGMEGNCLELIKNAQKNLEGQEIKIKEIKLRYVLP
jgi:hypothetical protein